MRGGDPDGACAVGPQMLEQLKNGATAGDLVIEHNDVAISDIADQRRDAHLGIAHPFFGAGRDRHIQPLCKGGRVLGIAKVGETTTARLRS